MGIAGKMLHCLSSYLLSRGCIVLKSGWGWVQFILEVAFTHYWRREWWISEVQRAFWTKLKAGSPWCCWCCSPGGLAGSPAGALHLACWGLASAQRQSCCFSFLMPLTARSFVVERNESLCSCFLGSARTVVTVPTWITGILRASHAQTQDYVICWDFFVSNDTDLAQLPGAFWLPTRKWCWGRGGELGGAVCGQGQWEHSVHPTVVWHMGQDGTDLPQACLAPCVLQPSLGLQPHRNTCSCFKKLWHSNNVEQSVSICTSNCISVFTLHFCVCILIMCAHFVAHSSCYILLMAE